MAPKTPPKAPLPPRMPTKQYWKNTPLDSISANKIWADVCNKTERMERKIGPFQLDVRKLIILAEKPNNLTPDVRGKIGPKGAVTTKEFDEAIKLIEKVDPIKQREKLPPEKYNLPLTVAQEYGWYSKPLIKKHPLFYYPKGMCEITEYANAYYRSQGKNPFQRKESIVKEDKGKGKEGDAKPKTLAKK